MANFIMSHFRDGAQLSILPSTKRAKRSITSKTTNYRDIYFDVRDFSITLYTFPTYMTTVSKWSFRSMVKYKSI